MAIIDDKTSRLDLPEPNADNFLQDDVARLRASLEKLDEVTATLDADKKLLEAQLPASVAKLDAQGVLLPAQIPSKVVQIDATGKIPLNKIPQAAMNTRYDAANESAMLALNATIGDICRRTDTGDYFMLLDNPASNRANWRQWHKDSFYDQFAQKSDPLSGIEGPLALKAEGQDDFDAATMKQLRAVVNTGDAATMSGVMNNFIGAVEWFNGSRETIPAGYIPADGQLVSRTDAKTSDLWAAVKAGMFAKTTEALWKDSGVTDPTNQYTYGINRGKYTEGDGSTNFRVPDLNGMQRASTNGFTGKSSYTAPFLRGDSGFDIGSMQANTAPNITANLSFHGDSTTNGTPIAGCGGAFSPVNGSGVDSTIKGIYIAATFDKTIVDGNKVTQTIPGTSRKQAGRASIGGAYFDASKLGSDSVYGRGNSNEVRPNAVVGIWIIRANGSFQAASTSFKVLNSDTTLPTVANTQVSGGEIHSEHQTAGVPDVRGFMRADYLIGGLTRLRLGVNSPSGTIAAGPYGSMDIKGDSSVEMRGDLVVSSGVPSLLNGIPNGGTIYTNRIWVSTMTLRDRVQGKAFAQIGQYVSNDPKQFRFEIFASESVASTGSVPKRSNIMSVDISDITAGSTGSGGGTNKTTKINLLGSVACDGYLNAAGGLIALGSGENVRVASPAGKPCIVMGRTADSPSDPTRRWYIGNGGADYTVIVHNYITGNNIQLQTSGGITLTARQGANGAERKFIVNPSGALTHPLGGDIPKPSSDARLKMNIKPAAEGALGRIEKIQAKEFLWKHNLMSARGYVAQELQDIDPLYVHMAEDGYLCPEQSALIADLISSVQTLSARIAELEARP